MITDRYVMIATKLLKMFLYIETFQLRSEITNYSTNTKGVK